MYSPFARPVWWCFIKCYDSKLGSDCNLDKDLKKDKKNDQLVKCKDTRLYLLLYIPIYHEK